MTFDHKKDHAWKREIVRDYKLAHGCMDCGYKAHAEALDFDHRPGTEKLFSVGNFSNRPLDAIFAEIEKCDVVCANCHRVRTMSRRNQV